MSNPKGTEEEILRDQLRQCRESERKYRLQVAKLLDHASILFYPEQLTQRAGDDSPLDPIARLLSLATEAINFEPILFETGGIIGADEDPQVDSEFPIVELVPGRQKAGLAGPIRISSAHEDLLIKGDVVTVKILAQRVRLPEIKG